jgi:hypothetical protein
MNQTNTKVQKATTATAPDTTMVMSSLSAFLSHLRICASRKEPAGDPPSPKLRRTYTKKPGIALA